jgi:hypothetical protein
MRLKGVQRSTAVLLVLDRIAAAQTLSQLNTEFSGACIDFEPLLAETTGNTAFGRELSSKVQENRQRLEVGRCSSACTCPASDWYCEAGLQLLYPPVLHAGAGWAAQTDQEARLSPA